MRSLRIWVGMSLSWHKWITKCSNTKAVALLLGLLTWLLKYFTRRILGIPEWKNSPNIANPTSGLALKSYACFWPMQRRALWLLSRENSHNQLTTKSLRLRLSLQEELLAQGAQGLLKTQQTLRLRPLLAAKLAIRSLEEELALKIGQGLLWVAISILYNSNYLKVIPLELITLRITIVWITNDY